MLSIDKHSSLFVRKFKNKDTWTDWKRAVFAQGTFTQEDTGQGRLSNPGSSYDDDVRQRKDIIAWNKLVLIIESRYSGILSVVYCDENCKV